MPKALIEHMKRGYAGSGLSSREVDQRVYGHLNNIGAMHGSKETAKGAQLESKAVKRARSKVTAKKYLRGED